MKQLLLLISLAVLSAIKVETKYDYIVTRDENSASHNIELIPKEEHKYTLIFLHGLGQNGKSNLKFFGNQPDARVTPLSMKIVLPTAPVREVTAENDEKMTSWFDIASLPIIKPGESATEHNIQAAIQQEKLDFSADWLLYLVEKEASLLKNDYSKIFIGGLDQGAAVSIAAFLKFKGKKPLGGVIGLSGMQGLNYTQSISFEDDDEKKRVQEQRKEIPMFLYHGTEDVKLPLKGSAASYDYLRNKVYKGSDNLEFMVEEDLGSEISEEEMFQTGKWIHKITKEKQALPLESKEMKDVKKKEPKLEKAIQTLKDHMDVRQLRKAGKMPQIYDQPSAFIHKKHHHKLHQNQKS